MARIFFAAILALVAMVLARWILGTQGYNPGLASRGNVLIDVAVMAPIGMIVYGLAAYFLRVHELHAAMALVRKKVLRKA
ncbi:unannotated protein [freshwater metagenome]|uniref:Unannotated protein n=1 Tax=freshwater metagenome TaxID=449393 RepID=A0A6J7SNP1_9ZZZZ